MLEGLPKNVCMLHLMCLANMLILHGLEDSTQGQFLFRTLRVSNTSTATVVQTLSLVVTSAPTTNLE